MFVQLKRPGNSQHPTCVSIRGKSLWSGSQQTRLQAHHFVPHATLPSEALRCSQNIPTIVTTTQNQHRFPSSRAAIFIAPKTWREANSIRDRDIWLRIENNYLSTFRSAPARWHSNSEVSMMYLCVCVCGASLKDGVWWPSPAPFAWSRG